MIPLDIKGLEEYQMKGLNKLVDITEYQNK